MRQSQNRPLIASKLSYIIGFSSTIIWAINSSTCFNDGKISTRYANGIISRCIIAIVIIIIVSCRRIVCYTNQRTVPWLFSITTNGRVSEETDSSELEAVEVTDENSPWLALTGSISVMILLLLYTLSDSPKTLELSPKDRVLLYENPSKLSPSVFSCVVSNTIPIRGRFYDWSPDWLVITY